MIIAALVLIVLGLLVDHGRMYFLIAGYNTLSKQEKARYAIKGIARVLRNGLVGMGLLVLLGHGIALWAGHPELAVLGLFLALLIGLPYLLVQANSRKFRLDDRDRTG